MINNSIKINSHMINNSTKINSHMINNSTKFQQSHDQQFHQDQQDNSLQIIEHKKYSDICWYKNPGPDLGWAHNCDGVKQVKGIPTISKLLCHTVTGLNKSMGSQPYINYCVILWLG